MNSGLFIRKQIYIYFFLLFVAGCATISVYDHYAYVQDTTLKVESLSLMDKAIDSFSVHQKAVEDLTIKLDKAYEYEKSRPKNIFTANQWMLIKDPGKNLLGGFLKRWSEKSVISKTIIDEQKGLVGDAFDMIIKLESEKIK